MLNLHSPVPLYHQLADILMERIRSGEYSPGDVIPSETSMAKHYGIGRPTVRQAMEILVRKGLVTRKRGAGTFVRHQDRQVDIFSFAGTSRAFSEKGIRAESKTIDPIRLDPCIKDKSNPFYGQPAFFFSRLTLVDDDPILFEEFCLHARLFSGIDKISLENRSLSQVISEKYYLKPGRGSQSFKIVQLPARLAKLLAIDPGDPILEVQRSLDFPGANQAVFSKLYCRTDRFAFSQTISLES